MKTRMKFLLYISYNGQVFKIGTIKEFKVCGIWFCRDADREYKLNITDKIDKLASKIKLRKSGNLTFEGKSLIIIYCCCWQSDKPQAANQQQQQKSLSKQGMYVCIY